MPNCYYVVSSDPETTMNDIQACAEGARVRPVGRGHRQGRYLVLVWFATFDEADANLDKIKDCLVRKRHTVHDCDILGDGGEFELEG